MSKSLNLSLLCLLLFTQLTYSNSKLFPGYYITNAGDSVLCNFDFNDWRVTPKKVIANVADQTVHLGPPDIKRFGIFGYGDYISASVTYHPEYMSGLNMHDQFSDSTETQARFLKIVTEGVYSLYELVLPQKVLYFISENGNTPRELIYRVRKKDLQIEEDNSYRNTLFELLQKEGIQHSQVTRLNKARYASKDLVSLVRALNSKYPTTKSRMKKPGDFQMDVFAGGISNFSPSAFVGRYSVGNSFDQSVSFSTGLNFQYILPSRFKRFAFGVSAGYDEYKFATSASGSFSDSPSVNWHSTTTFKEEFFVENKLILINLYGRYTVNPLNKIKVYVKAGVNCNITIGKNEGMLTTYSAESKGVRNGNVPTYNLAQGSERFMQLRGMYYNLRADIGIIAGLHKLEFGYFTPATLNPGAPFKIAMIGAHYYYTILK